MSAEESTFALKDEGIPQEHADAANDEVEEMKTSRKPGSQPLMLLPHGKYTRKASNYFLESIRNTQAPKLAQLLETSDVENRFVGSEPGACVDLESPREQKSLRTDYVYTILALNDMSYSNGLPAIGPNAAKFYLRKGEALHFMGDQLQTWSGRGGGNLIWFYWRNLKVRK